MERGEAMNRSAAMDKGIGCKGKKGLVGNGKEETDDKEIKG